MTADMGICGDCDGTATCCDCCIILTADIDGCGDCDGTAACCDCDGTATCGVSLIILAAFTNVLCDEVGKRIDGLFLLTARVDDCCCEDVAASLCDC